MSHCDLDMHILEGLTPNNADSKQKESNTPDHIRILFPILHIHGQKEATPESPG